MLIDLSLTCLLLAFLLLKIVLACTLKNTMDSRAKDPSKFASSIYIMTIEQRTAEECRDSLHHEILTKSSLQVISFEKCRVSSQRTS